MIEAYQEIQHEEAVTVAAILLASSAIVSGFALGRATAGIDAASRHTDDVAACVSADPDAIVVEWDRP